MFGRLVYRVCRMLRSFGCRFVVGLLIIWLVNLWYLRVLVGWGVSMKCLRNVGCGISVWLLWG